MKQKIKKERSLAKLREMGKVKLDFLVETASMDRLETTPLLETGNDTGNEVQWDTGHHIGQERGKRTRDLVLPPKKNKQKEEEDISIFYN